MTSDIKKFRKIVLDHYKQHGRILPWRENTNPYWVLVSEVMLQQTQVPRGLVKFPEFIEVFPTVEALAAATTPEVLAAWQGLGYNRRALYLKRAAEIIVRSHAGVIPDDPGCCSNCRELDRTQRHRSQHSHIIAPFRLSKRMCGQFFCTTFFQEKMGWRMRS